MPMKWVRLEREGTDSWMTYRLPHVFYRSETLEAWLAFRMPGWRWVTAAHINPDTDCEEENGEPDEEILGPCVDDA